MHLQTTRNAQAKGITGVEFAKRVMPRFQKKAEAVMQKHAGMLHGGEDATPVYSYDHASPHDAAEAEELLEKLGITQDRAPLPPLSPDFHRVIEHAHGISCKAFEKVLRRLDTKKPIDFYKKLYEKCFREAVQARSVQQDIRGLKQLYKHVCTAASQGGSEGDWPPNHML